MNHVFYTNSTADTTDALCQVAAQSFPLGHQPSLIVIRRPERDLLDIQKGDVVILAPDAVTLEIMSALRRNAVFVFLDVGGSNAICFDFYDVRVMAPPNAPIAALATTLRGRLLASPFFVSTRSVASATPSHQMPTTRVLVQGLAKGGGLFVPTTLPLIPLWELQEISTRCGVSYEDTAQSILEKFFCAERSVGSVLTPQTVRNAIREAYHSKHWRDERVCPLRRVSPGVSLLELFHGPTAAFKDFALQLFPRLFGLSWRHGERFEQTQCLVLAATSGDTGIAAIQGFVNDGDPNTKVFVLYPLRGVSEVQRLQMLRADGPNARAVGIEGDFDFCQATVKEVFASARIASSLKQKHNCELSSANSINWGRLAPQIVYYFHAYFSAIQSGDIPNFGDRVQFVVPTGNFGNILCGYLAGKMGLPIGKITLASNENNVLSDFVETGTYDIRNRNLRVTTSPSIDILRASNVERFLYYLTDGDGAEVAGYMRELDKNNFFEVKADVKSKLQSIMTSGTCSEAQCKETISSVFKETGMVVDTHTAVAMFVAKKTRVIGEHQIIVSTAHWAKFPHAVLSAMSGGKEVDPSMPLADVFQGVTSMAPNASPVPPVFLEKRSKVLLERVCGASVALVEKEMEKFLVATKGDVKAKL